MSASVREAAPADAPALAAIEILTAPEFATFLLDGLVEGRSAGSMLAEIYARDGTDSWEWSWVAEEDGEVVGAIGAYPVSLVRPSSDTGEAAARLAYFAPVGAMMPPDAFHIARLGVLEPYRRGGVARALVEAVLGAAWAREDPRVTLFVWEENGGARRFYDRLGFGEIGRVTLPPHPRALCHGTMLLLEKRRC